MAEGQKRSVGKIDLQDPTGSGAETQAELGGVATLAAPAKATLVPKWSAKLPEQIRAVRSVVMSADASWSAEEVARCFKGARRGAVAAVLDSLAALGLLVAYEAEGVRR